MSKWLSESSKPNTGAADLVLNHTIPLPSRRLSHVEFFQELRLFEALEWVLFIVHLGSCSVSISLQSPQGKAGETSHLCYFV